MEATSIAGEEEKKEDSTQVINEAPEEIHNNDKVYTVEELLEINAKLLEENEMLKETIVLLRDELKRYTSEIPITIIEEDLKPSAEEETENIVEESKTTQNNVEPSVETKTENEIFIVDNFKDEMVDAKTIGNAKKVEDSSLYNLKEQNNTKRVRTIMRTNNDIIDRVSFKRQTATLPEPAQECSSEKPHLNFTLRSSKVKLKDLLRRSDFKSKFQGNIEAIKKDALTLLRYTPPSDNNTQTTLSMSEYEDVIRKVFERAPNDALPRGLQSFNRDSGFVYTVGNFYHNIEEETNSKCLKSSKSSDKLKLETAQQPLVIDEDVGDTASLVACGANSTIIVADQGIFIKSSNMIGGRVCIGVPNIPITANSNFSLTTKYIIGRRLVKVACGAFHFAAISDANEVIIWGENRIVNNVKSNQNSIITGQLGVANLSLSTPRFAVGISGTVIDIACGMYHTVAASSFGVYSCGINNFGQLGRDGTAEEFQIVPGLFNDDGVPYTVIAVACGLYHTVAQTKCGALFMWGKNQGMISDRDPNHIFDIPKEVTQFTGSVKSVACGYYHTCVLVSNDGVYTCGGTVFGQLGRGKHKKEFDYFEKVYIPNYKSVESVSCGCYSSFALKKNGEVYTWGFLSNRAKTNHQYNPRLMDELSEKNLYVKSVAAGASHCCFLVDKRATNCFDMFLKACVFSTRIPISEMIQSLPSDLSSLKFIQERALKKLQSNNPNIPSISIDKAYIYYNFANSTMNTTIQYITIKNNSMFEIEITVYVPEGQSQSMTGVALGAHPTKVILAASDSTTIRMNIKHNQESEAQFFICVLASSSIGAKINFAKDTIRYYVFTHLVPFFGSVDTYRKLEEKNNTMLLSQLASHVPQEILFRLCSSGLPSEPTVHLLQAAVLILDISGFTTLTHHLSQAGQSGGETITEYLNSYFSMLINVVNKHGGDIAKFVGDALICLFTNEPHWNENPDPIDQLLLRAIQCAIEVQTDCAEYSREGLKLTLHIAVGAGELSSMIVGGTNHIWHYFVSGSAISNLNSALESSSTGEVVVSGNSWGLVEKYCDAEQRGNDWKINKVNQVPPLRSLTQHQIPIEAELAFRSIVPHFVQNAYERGARVDELRKATVMFIKLSNIQYTDNVQSNCEMINKYVLIMQQEIFRQEGMIIQFFEDEKGTLLLASFGLPPLSHEDDPIRAVRSAMAVHDMLLKVGVKSAIGVTTGDLFCGLVGSTTRKEYTIISSSVNLASRIMGVVAKLGGGVLCDQATRDACYPRLQFETLEPVVVKGTVDPVPIFKPFDSTIEEIQQRRRSSAINPITTIVGRRKILHKIKTHLHELVRGNSTWVTIITGPEGIGKSTLAYFAVQIANTLGVNALIGLSDPLQRASPFYVWKQIILQLLDLNAFNVSLINPADLAKELIVKLECEADFLPLFNNILPINLPSNSVCDKLSNSARNSFILGVLKRLIEKKANHKPLLIVLENLHWIDSLSLTLATYIAKLQKPILLLVTVRPIQETEVNKYANFFSSPNIRHINIPPLSHKHCEKLAISLFKAQENVKVPQQINTIISMAQGNPYFCVELLLGFRDSNLISVNQFGNWVVSPNLKITEIPSSVESAINSRIDCLAASTQDVLKIASVIGQEFEVSILELLCKESRIELEGKLNLLVKLDFLRYTKTKYSFISESVYKIAYSRLLFAQRKDLHERLALHYEEKHSNSPQIITLLAYHWDQVVLASTAPSSHAISKAINYMKLAGEIATRQEDNAEASYCFSRSLELLQKSSNTNLRESASEEETSRKRLKLQVMGMALKEFKVEAPERQNSF